MSVKENFESAWKTRFSTSDLPELPCLENISDSQELETAYKTSRKKIEKLKKELNQQEFIAGFIWDQLHSSHSAVNNIDKNSQGNDDQVSNVNNIVDTNGLDAKVPLVKSESLSEQEELWYRNVDLTLNDGDKKKLECEDSVFSDTTSDTEREAMTDLRSFLGSLSSETDIKTVEIVQSSSNVCERNVNDKTKQQAAEEVNNPNESEINKVKQVIRNHEDKTRAAVHVYEDVKPTTFKETNLDDLTVFQAGYRSSLTDNEKVLLHTKLDRTDSASSGDSSTGERRRRPPVPTPRPSIKGPTLHKRTSGGSVKETNHPSNGSDSDPLEEFKQEYYGGVVVDEKKKQSSPSSVTRGVKVQKSAPPLLKRRGDKKETMANKDVACQQDAEVSNTQTEKIKLQMNQKSKSLDSGSPSVDSPPLPARASGIYRRGVYVNDDDKLKQKFLQRNFRVDSKGSQCSMDSVDETYDNVVPVHKEDGETSSDEEEPIYYNVLLMKQHSLHKVSTLIAHI